MSDELAHLVGVIGDVKYPCNTRFMFPSKVGGKPAWLIPEFMPEVKCDSCSKDMTFLLQVYAPDSDREDAFHRSIMIFTCLGCRCFFKCFRAQLPRFNSFYPTEIKSSHEVPLEDAKLDSQCCESCGSKIHTSLTCRPLPEFGLEIEEIDEINMDEDEDGDSSDEDDLVDEANQRIQHLAVDSEMTLDDSETSLFDDFTETALENDASFRMFKRFVDEAPVNQVLYYCAGGSPLWLSDEKQLLEPPSDCEYCLGKRRFEFQIQPQLIYHLMKRLKGFPMNAAPFEWGVIAVYTCTNNCSVGPQYKEEFVYNQLEPEEWLSFDSRKKVDFTKDSKSTQEAPQVIRPDDSDDGEWI